ncbi:DUF1648 domain-containing protein [Nocardioides sp. YIM 152588]|uniref:DUF1648 domain-containing protein n=1 Tax=Nocardioides sp. YIM 152588 TaxID=3158259 RepID=UPI0032E4A376
MSVLAAAARSPRTGGPALWAFATACGLYAVAWLVATTELPERVPLHYDLRGDVDRWGDRATLLAITGVVGVGVAALIAVLAFTRIPITWVNAPHKAWWTATEERVERLRALVRVDALWIGAMTLTLLAVLLFAMVRTADLEDPHLDTWFFAALGVYLLLIAGYTAYGYLVRYRPDE